VRRAAVNKLQMNRLDDLLENISACIEQRVEERLG
jgi:hypothetical protein